MGEGLRGYNPEKEFNNKEEKESLEDLKQLEREVAAEGAHLRDLQNLKVIIEYSEEKLEKVFDIPKEDL